ncbi:MAG: hypothetical protein ABSG86_29480 [Thermoguttaceae bacterium]|jgi:hypothetical protein
MLTLESWITWAFRPAESSHRFAAHILARQAARDLGAEVTEPDFEDAMARAGFVVHRRTRHGSACYLATDSSAKRDYDFRRFILADPIEHPLSVVRPDPCAAFKGLPASDQAVLLDWIKASLVPIRRTRSVSQLRFPCSVVTGLAIRDEQMRGALLTAGVEPAGHRFRCCLTNEALAQFRQARRAQASRVQPEPALDAGCFPSLTSEFQQ